jgi:NADH:ubiquinone oxidoreductase subunit
MRNEYKNLIGKPEGKRSLGRHRRRWEDNIRNDLRKIGLEAVGWMHLAQDRAVVNMEIKFRVLQKGRGGGFLTSWVTASQEGFCTIELVI